MQSFRAHKTRKMGAVGLILVGLVASLFLGCILPSGNPIQRLTSGVFSFAKNKVVQRLFGARGVKAVEDFWHYVAWEPNPLLQIMYLFLVAGGFLIGFELAFVHVPNPYIPSYHKCVVSADCFARCIRVRFSTLFVGLFSREYSAYCCSHSAKYRRRLLATSRTETTTSIIAMRMT